MLVFVENAARPVIAVVGWSVDVLGGSAAALGVELVAVDRLATVPEGVVGGLIAPGVEGFESAAVAADVAVASVPIAAVDPGDLPADGVDPRRCAVARAGGRVIYGRGEQTARWALAHLRAWAFNPPVTINFGQDPEQVGDLWTPPHRPGPWPVVVLLHGGFWRRQWERDLMDRLAADLALQGFAAWNLEYRRLGAGGGWPLSADDVSSGIEHLGAMAGDYPVDLDRVVLLGHGSGGQLALWAAAREAPPGLRLVVGLGALCDLALAMREGTGDTAIRDFLSIAPDQEAALAEASPVNHISLTIPVQLAHTTDDAVVPVNQSRAYVAAVEVAAEASGESLGTALDRVRLYDFNTGDHFEALEPTWKTWTAIVNEIARRTDFFPSQSVDALDPLASRLDNLFVALAADPRFAGAWWESNEGGRASLVVALVDAHPDEANRLVLEHDLPPGRLSVRPARHSLGRLRHYLEIVSQILDARPDQGSFLTRVSPRDYGVVVGSERADWELVARIITSIPCDALQLCIGPERRVGAYLDAGELRHPAIETIAPDPDPDLPSRAWLRRRRFGLRRWDLGGFDESMDNDRVDALVDGTPLGQALRPFDSAWAGVPYALVAPPSRHWLGEPQAAWAGDGGAVVIDGSCGIWQCCGVTAHIHVADNTVAWAIDRDGHGWDHLWRWRRVAWFHFDRTEYETALAALPELEVEPPPRPDS